MASLSLSSDAVRALAVALCSESLGNEVATSINGGGAANAWAVAQVVTNAAASTTLAGVLPGDLVVDLTTVANNVAASILVVTANTLAFTPTLHDVLVVLRAVPAATSFKF